MASGTIGSITINGQTFQPPKGGIGTISVSASGKVLVDGVDITKGTPATSQGINIVVNGPIESLEVEDCASIQVHGDVGTINATNGDVTAGTVSGSVHNVNGDVQCGSVGGDVRTTNGDITRAASAPLPKPRSAQPATKRSR